jgi:hypothetical protein
MAKRKAVVSDDESAALSGEESEAVATESESDEPPRKSKGKAKASKAKVQSIKVKSSRMSLESLADDISETQV